MPSKRSLPDYALVFALALVVHLLVLTRFVGSPLFPPFAGELKFYADWAEQIAAGHWSAQGAFPGLPGYPFLLAGLFSLGANYYAVGLLQILCEAAIAALIFQMAAWLYPGARGRWAGIVAAVGWTFFQPAQAFSLVLTPAIWGVLAFWALFFWSMKTASVSRWRPWLGIGVVAGLAATAVPAALAILPLSLAAAARRLRGPAAIAAAAACLGLGALVGTAPCWVYNRVLAKEPVWFSAQSGLNAWIGHRPHANGYPELPPEFKRADQAAMLKESILFAQKETGRTLTRGEASQFWADKATAFLREHPGQRIVIALVKMRNFWNAARHDDLGVVQPFTAQGVVTPGLGYGIVALFALAALPFSWRRWPASRWVLGAVLLQMLALVPGYVTESGRLLAVPGLVLLASGTVVGLAQTLASGEVRQAWKYAGALLAATVLVFATSNQTKSWQEIYQEGQGALQGGDLYDAYGKLVLARQMRPGVADTLNTLGVFYQIGTKKDLSQAAFSDALGIDPEYPEALVNLGKLELAEGNAASAKARGEAALKVEPDNTAARDLLKTCLEKAQ
ncbi:MAG: hypothetical protein ACFUZC_23205 [Chthoniobacteraceae bacterium]